MSQQRFSPARLREQRERAELSREQLAVAISRSWNSIYAYERGRVVPTTDIVACLADALGCELADLFDNAGAPALR